MISPGGRRVTWVTTSTDQARTSTLRCTEVKRTWRRWGESYFILIGWHKLILSSDWLIGQVRNLFLTRDSAEQPLVEEVAVVQWSFRKTQVNTASDWLNQNYTNLWLVDTDDPFGLDAFLDTAKKASKRGNDDDRRRDDRWVTRHVMCAIAAL